MGVKEINETAKPLKILSSSGIMETASRSVSLFDAEFPVSTVAPYLGHSYWIRHSEWVKILVLLYLVAVSKLRVAT
jgi:hypothetical protein